MSQSKDKPRILVVDDDSEIRRLASDLLNRNGMVAINARNTVDADRVVNDGRIDLIVLDVMMPGEDGLSYCRRLRQSSNIPVIMLTALGEDIDRIIGLELGADDYLPKPFNPRELVTRIKTVLRRAPPLLPGESHRLPQHYAFGDYLLDVDERELVKKNGTRICLTSGEYALLQALVEHSPRILSRDQLLELTRGAVPNQFDRSIDSQVSRLRRKIEQNPRHAEYIKTVRNIGYAFSGRVIKVNNQSSVNS
ncbi:MAG: response regulator [Pseudomonadota bacterium]